MTASRDTPAQPREPIPMATPIIVVGMNRSGTKWLSNLLCRHSEVAGVQSQRHCGIIETNLFGQMQHAVGDIRRREEYAAFIELWAATDFFRAAGIDKQLFYHVRPRPEDCFAAFRLLMEEVARRQGKRFWLQKTSPLQLDAVTRSFPDARLVMIRRNMRDTLRSEVQYRRQNVRGASIARHAAVYVLQDKLLRKICHRTDSCYLTYESLSADTEGELRRVCGFLGIEFQAQMLVSGFERNTSFRAADQRQEVFSPREGMLIGTVDAAARCVPYPLLRWLRQRFVIDRTEFVAGTFGEVAQEHGFVD